MSNKTVNDSASESINKPHPMATLSVIVLLVLSLCWLISGMLNTSALTASLEEKSPTHKVMLETYFACKGNRSQCRLYALESVKAKKMANVDLTFNDMEIHLNAHYRK